MGLEFDLVKQLEKSGFKHSRDLVHAYLGGSFQHGARLPGKGDIDIYGVYVEDPVRALGLGQETHFTNGTSDQHERNKEGDEDYKVYTLRRWAGLAAKGNPTILGALYTKIDPTFKDCVWATHILPNVRMFQASSHASAFLGYATGQVARLAGIKGHGKHGQRKELIDAYQYDTKAGMHLMRLMYEAEEYLSTGHITYPRPERDVLLEIRQGSWNWAKLFLEYNEMEKRVKEAEANSKLPKHINREDISELITKAYFSHWKQTGYTDNMNLIDPNLDRLDLI